MFSSISSLSYHYFWLGIISISLILTPALAWEQCSWQFRPHPEDCGSFLICNFGVPLVQRCPQGTHWNQRILTCDWPRSALCELEPLPLPNPRPGTQYSDGENSLHWDQDERSDAGKPCFGLDFAPHPTDCSKYYVCDHGALLEMSCSAPLVWNSAHTTCDWTGCTISTGGGSGGGDGPTPPPTTQAPPIPTSTSGPPAPPPGFEEEGEGPPSPPPTISTTTKRPGHKPPHKPPTTSTTPTSGGLPGPDPTIVGIITGPSSNDDLFLEPDYKVVCYYTGWSWYRPGEGKFGPSDVDGDLCTHYVYAFAVLDATTWTIKPADAWVDIDNKFYSQITQLKKKGKKASIALGGWNDSEGQKYSLLLRDPVKIRKLIDSVVKFVKEHDFDGIDLDYEYPVCPHGECHEDFASDRNGFTILVKGLRAALPKGSLVSAAVSASKGVIDRAYDVRTLGESLDWIGVMDYDIHGSWEKNTGHIAPLYHHPIDTKDWLNVNYSIHHWINKGAPPSKLVMGVPFYGQAFTLLHPGSNKSLNAPAKGPGTPGTYSRQRGILAYYEICSAEWSERVDDEEGRMGPFLVQGDQWVSYDDANFIRKKMDYVKEMGLGGAMAWALDFDDFNNKCGDGRYPLLTAMKESLAVQRGQGGQMKEGVAMEGGGKGDVLYMVE